MNGRMWNIGNNDSLERIFFLPQNIRNLNLFCIAEFYEMMKCDWMLYDIYFFNITSMMQPGQWNISGRDWIQDLSNIKRKNKYTRIECFLDFITMYALLHGF